MFLPTRRVRRALEFPLARLSSAVAVCAALAAFCHSAEAANFQWDPAGDQTNSGGSGTWDLTSLFWNDDAAAPDIAWPNLNDSVAVFGGGGGVVTIDTGVGGTGVTTNGLIFSVDGYTIGSDEASEHLTLAGTAPTVQVATGTTTINSVLAGTGGFSQTGGGTLVLAADNTGFSGAVSVADGGVLRLTNGNALTNSVVTLDNSVTVGGVGTSLDLAGVTTGAGVSLVMNANATPGNRTSLTATTGNAVFNGGIEMNGDGLIQFNASAGASLTLNGTLTGGVGHSGTIFLRGAGTGILNGDVNAPGGTLNKTEVSTWTINSAVINVAAVQVSDGTMKLGHADAIPTGLKLTIGQASSTSGAFDLNGFDQTVAGLVTAAGSTGTNHRIVNSGATASTFTINDSASGTFDGHFEGTMNIVKNGTGTLSIRGSAASTFTGNLTVNAGTVDFQADNKLGNGNNDILLDGGRLDYTGSADWDPGSGRTITIGPGGGTLGGSRAIRITDAGQIQGSGTLTRAGTATTHSIDISAANTGFTGNVVVESGTIEYKNSLGLGSGAGQSVTVNGGQFSVAGINNFGAVLPHAVTLSGGSLAFNNQIGGTVTGNVDVTADSGISVRDFYQLANRGGAIAGVLSGSGKLTVTGATGTLVGGTPNVGSVLLSNPGNTYSGTLSIGPAAQVRAVQGGGVDALASASVELNGGGLGLAPVVSAAGSNGGLFGRYYNSAKINNGVAGGFDWGTEPMALSRNDADINYATTVPAGSGVNTVNMGVLWTGILEVTTGGSYAFSFRSDDGSMIYVDGQMVVANDFSQGPTERFGSINLTPGFHSIIAKYAQGTGGATAQAFYNGPDTANTKVTLGSVPGSLTNNGSALFGATTMDNAIQIAAGNGDIDLAGANATSTGAMTFSANAALRVTGVTGFETLTQTGSVTLNGTNTLTAGITLTGNQTATHGHNSSGADFVIAGNINEAAAGSGIIKMGPRTVTLTGTNTFTGPIVVNEGKLVGNTASLPTAITTNATIEFNQTADGVYNQVIDGTGALIKSGEGTLSLNAANTFTGPTTVTGGTLAGTGSLASAVTVNHGGAIAGASGSTFTVGDLILNANSSAKFALGAPSLAPLIVSEGSVEANVATVNLTDAGGLAGGTYRLIDYAGAALTPTQFAGFASVSGPAGFFYGLVNNSVDTSVDLTVEAGGALNTWTGATNGTWDTSTTNWSSGNFANGQRVTFADGPANRSISGGLVSPQGITVNSSAGNDYTISNPISGTLAAGLQKNGASTLHLTGANTFTGAVAINGGTLRADVSSVASALGSGAVTIGAGATLQLDATADTSTNGVSSRYFTTAATATAGTVTTLGSFDFTQSAPFGVPVVLQTDTNLDPAAYTTTNKPAGGAVGFQDGTTSNWRAFGVERTGKIQITTAGWYSFFTGSDDASRILIDGNMVANADGGHGVIDGAGAVFLTPGLHDFHYEFLQGTGGADERIQWAGPGFSRVTIPSSVMFAAETASVEGTSNDVNIGTPVTTVGDATIALGGNQFTGVRLGAMVTNGGTLHINGESGKSLRATVTVLNAPITIDASATFAPGKVNDLGSAVTVTKTGSGTLLLDNIASGAGASVLSPGSVLRVEQGTLKAVGSTQAGATNPLGAAKVQLDGGTLELNSRGGTVTWSNPIELESSSRVFVGAIGIQTNISSSMSIPAGQVLTLDVAGGARSGAGGYGGQSVTTTAFVTGLISGAGGLSIQATQTDGGQSPAGSNVTLATNPTYTGLTQIVGFPHSQMQLELRGTATLQNTSGVNTVGKLVLENVRLNLQNNAGGNLADRIPDAWPVEMNFGTLRLDGANATSSNETVGPITLKGGQNNLFGGTVSGTAFHTLTAPSITRENRATLRLDANNLGSLTATNGIRFVFTDASGFNKIGGGSTTATNASIIPWVWGAPTGNNRTLATYDANGLRLLADTEYTTLAASIDATDNIRELVENTTLGSGAAQTINALVLVNTTTGDRTLTLNSGTVLNITSGAILLGTTDATARRVTLTGGAIDFGAAEGVIVANRREHLIQTKLSGTNGLTISGDGQVTLNQATNDFTGLITVTGGVSTATTSAQLNVQNDGSLGNVDNDIILDGAGLRFATGFTVNANRNFTLTSTGGTLDTGGGSGTVAGQVSGPGGLFKVGANTLTLNNAANDYEGETTVLNGNLTTNTGPQGNIHHFSPSGSVTFDQSFDGTYAGDIDGTGSVAKSGAGVVTLTGDHTYVGTTTINGGTLMVNGSIAGSTTTVNAGMLGGAGSIAYNVNVGNSSGVADATLSPGAGLGTLTVGGSVTFNSDAAFKLEINTTSVTSDLLASSGAVTLGLGVIPLDASDLGSANLNHDETFTFITAAGGVFGEFAGLPNGALITIGSTDFHIDYGTDFVRLVAVPEPASFAGLLGGFGILAGLQRRRRKNSSDDLIP